MEATPPSFDDVFASALAREPAPKETPFEDALSAFAEVVARVLPGDAPRPLDWTARPEWAEVLGVDLPCTEDDLRRAYKRAAFATHPDRGGSGAEFVKVTRALESARGRDGQDEFARPLPSVTARYASAMKPSAPRSSIVRAA